MPKKRDKKTFQPLAERMRPLTFDDFMGQEDITGEKLPLRSSMEKGALPSVILWGPPGSGKTTLARLIAGKMSANFESISAVLSGVRDVRAIMEKAARLKAGGTETILFVDEVHRFNKAQQDAFLHHIEDGTITFIGATTENPSFEVVPPLLSRCKVLVLREHSQEGLISILKRALKDRKRGLGEYPVEMDDDVLGFVAAMSHGDARTALNSLEELVNYKLEGDEAVSITMSDAEEVVRKKALLYDKGGEEHYNVISAFIKSMRGSDPDGAVYWLARMLEAGEDPLFVARRMVIFASEDVGNADPRAITVALAAKDAFHFVGMPEGWIPLAQAATYLATAPKSNASYMAYREAKKDVKNLGALPVPLHIRNAPTKLMKGMGYGKGYMYPHDYSDAVVNQQFLPEKLKKKRYYRPKDSGYEKRIMERMDFIKGKKGK
ncbi:MAG: replication-associated recombination protein A [Deltaproteobacteria bacterium]|nr:replication-associated recombination protein A [Deltaproteobacteria bacterium]